MMERPRHHLQVHTNCLPRFFFRGRSYRYWSNSIIRDFFWYIHIYINIKWRIPTKANQWNATWTSFTIKLNNVSHLQHRFSTTIYYLRNQSKKSFVFSIRYIKRNLSQRTLHSIQRQSSADLGYNSVQSITRVSDLISFLKNRKLIIKQIYVFIHQTKPIICK